MPQIRHSKILPQPQAASACRRHHKPMSAPPAWLLVPAGATYLTVQKLLPGNENTPRNYYPPNSTIAAIFLRGKVTTMNSSAFPTLMPRSLG